MKIDNRNNIDIKDRLVTVIGIGRSGLAAARLAHYLGAKVFISDNSTNKTVTANLQELQLLGIEGELGSHSSRIFEADLWILSPGIAQDSDLVRRAQSKAIPIISEIEFASWFTDAPILAVTGSNGKTTTVHALALMCQTEKIHGVLAGNMGVPFAKMVLADLTEPDPARVFILEISSFQMEFIHHFQPRVSVFLNITSDHLDRYHSMAEYIDAKLNLAHNAGINDYVVLNLDDPILTERLKTSPAWVVPFSIRQQSDTTYFVNNTKVYTSEHATLIPLDAVALPGRHNLANLLAAATAAHLIGVPDQTIAMVMQSFTGIPHRLEDVALVDGVKYINDSKATNLDAVKVALMSFPGPIILILGGKDKGSDFRELIPYFENKVKQIIAIGQAQTPILSALRDAVRPICVDGLRDAVKITRDSAKPGDVVLLSPGCASFDQFRDFEDRGDQFRVLVKELETST